MSEKEIVLVTGATGRQGGAVARALLKNGYAVKALTRNSDSPAAQGLQESGIEIVTGDLADKSSLAKALAGIEVVFAMTTPFQKGHDAEVAQGINMIEASKAAGVGHLVFSSVASADKKTGIPHFDSKYKVEQHLAGSGIAYTIIGPTAFMENFIQPFALPNLREGRLARALQPSRPLQLIAVEDIGSFVAYVIVHRDKFRGKRMDIAGDNLSGDQTAAVLSKVTGKAIRYESIPPASLRAQNPDLAIMMEWQAKNNYDADIDSLRRDFPEVGWHTFEQWARMIDWKSLLAS